MTNGNPRCGFRTLPTLVLALLATALPAYGKDVAPREPIEGEFGRTFDLRTTLEAGVPLLSSAQARAVARLRAELPELLVSTDERTGGVRTLSNAIGFLTGPNGGDAERIALEFVTANADLFGLSAEDLRNYETTDLAYSEATGVTHLYLRQRHAGLAVYNGQLHANVAADGRILSINNQFVPGLALAVNATRATVSADEAVAALAAHLGVDELGATPSAPQLMLLPIRPSEVRLVWNFNVDLGSSWYDVTVDALDGRVWTRFDWVADVNDYRVYQRPVEAPTFTTPLPPADGRTLQTGPANPTASPFGWHDTNGVAGNEFTRTRGNNVHAYTDIDANNVPDAGSDPECGATILCDFPLDLTLPPSGYRPAAVANLFYWNNVIHDVAFLYGFTPANANFQVNTYGGGGLGNDDVQAEAQDGAGVNNANFGTPPDGSRPRMQMFIWTAPTPDRDGDVDNGIIVHEYGHGISNRLVGGGTNVNCLQNAEQPGEGLSDWWTLFYTFEASSPDVRGIGTYALNQPTTGQGIRTARYDKAPEPNTNPWTYASLPGSAIPHGVGEKWAQAYWYAMGRLEDEHGFDANVYNFTGTAADAGNVRAMFYIIEGLENAVCSPGFVDVRNAVIAAATASYGGEDVCLLWEAFAEYGLGFSASQGSSNSINDQTPAFDLPPSCTGGGGNEFCATPNLPIPDNVPAGVTNVLNVPDTGTLTDLNVSVTMQPDHTFLGDLIIRLTKGATTITMVDRPGIPVPGGFGCSINLDSITLDDEALGGPIESPPNCTVTANVLTGEFTPNGPLSGFDGMELSGDWTIFLSDNAGGDLGTLAEWCLITETAGGEPDIAVDPTSIDETLAPGASVTVPLDIENVGTADLDWTIDETEPLLNAIAPHFAAPQHVASGREGEHGADLVGTGTRNRVYLDRSDGKSSVVSATQGGGAILNQLPNQVNGFFSDAACALCGTGQQSIADNFALTAPATVGTITIWAGYFPGDVPNTTDHWTVILHSDTGGLPGAAIYTENDVADSAVQTGIILFGVHEWEVTLTLATPQVLAPGTYWLEIFNNSGTGGSPDDIFWETGNPDTVGNGLPNSAFATATPGVTWNANAGFDLAVQLDGPGGGGGCTPPTDVPWLSLDTTSGTTPPAATSTVQVTLDATGLATGTYEAVLCIESNDPDEAQVQVPVTLTVAGEPDIEVSPTSLTSSLGPDEQETQTLDIENLGDVDLDWTIEEAPGPITFPIGGLTFYTDRSTFDSDFPGLPIEDFEDTLVPPGGVLGCPAPFDMNTNNACFAPGSIEPGIAIQDNPLNGAGGGDPNGLAVAGVGFLGAVSDQVLANTFIDSFEMVFDPPVNAVGGDLIAYFTSGSPVNITIFDENDVQIGSTTATATNPAGSFWGVGSPTPIGRINILSTLPAGDGAEGMDDIAFGAVAGGPCASPADVPWLSLDVTSGTTPPAATSSVDVTFDSTGLAAGTYEALLCIDSNDPDTPLVEVPVTLNVDSMPFLDGFETGDTSRWSFVLPRPAPPAARQNARRSDGVPRSFAP